jgi:hypothetical protein
MNLRIREKDSTLKERVPQVADIYFVLFIELKNIVHECVLSSAPASHDVDRNNGREFESEVTLCLSFGGGDDGFLHELIEFVDNLVVHLGETLDYISSNAANVLFFVL